MKRAGGTEQLLAEIASAVMVSRVIDRMAKAILYRGGRLFVLGVGGSAANASHAVGDFRKLCGIEAYCPSDNVAELTARTNDEGWQTVFAEWLMTSALRREDTLLVFSVGGGNWEGDVSRCLVLAIDYAKAKEAMVLGVTADPKGHLARLADEVVIVRCDQKYRTPVCETVQVAVCHALANHPLLRKKS